MDRSGFLFWNIEDHVSAQLGHHHWAKDQE